MHEVGGHQKAGGGKVTWRLMTFILLGQQALCESPDFLIRSVHQVPLSSDFGSEPQVICSAWGR